MLGRESGGREKREEREKSEERGKERRERKERYEKIKIPINTQTETDM